MQDSYKYTIFWLEKINAYSGDKFEHKHFEDKKKDFGKIEIINDSTLKPEDLLNKVSSNLRVQAGLSPNFSADEAVNSSGMQEAIRQWQQSQKDL